MNYNRGPSSVVLPLLIAFSAASAYLTATSDLTYPSSSFVGSRTCAECHSSIYATFSTTPMARSSGPINIVQEDLTENEFVHAKSGVRYRILRDDHNGYLEFSRPRGHPENRLPIQGLRRLDYFVGSGAVGRSYFFSLDGFLFQSPASYYSLRRKWDISPGYEHSETMDLTRPVEVDCLRCHAGQLQPVSGTQNRFQNPAFQENGIGCERCHGPGKLHVEQLRSGIRSRERLVVNPAKLESKRRDSICAQCHLTGEVQVVKPGRSLRSFQPGDLLSDFAVSFVWDSAQERGLKVHSHYERLWQSECKKRSGDKLWCGSCHDPHAVPDKAGKQDYFRRKCMACHRSSDCNADSHLQRASKGDCIACHMPKNDIVGIEHTVYTDHAIPRNQKKAQLVDSTQNLVLRPFADEDSSKRDLGLAYSKLAAKYPEQAYIDQAFQLLRQAVEEKAGDAELFLHFGYLHQAIGSETKAVTHYKQALELDSTKLEAAVNLGAILAKGDDYSAAIRLWEDALSRNPGIDAARINLALAYLRQGDQSAGQKAILRALEFQPDSSQTQKLLAEVGRKTIP